KVIRSFIMKSGCLSCALAAASSSALGINHRKITHTSTSSWAMPVRSSAPIALRYSASIRAWAHRKLIRQSVLTVIRTELNCSNAASFVMPAAANPRQAPSSPQFRGGSRWPRTIRIRQDASVPTAEPAIAVARDQIIDRVADHPWGELEDPCPLPARKLARNAQHGFGLNGAIVDAVDRTAQVAGGAGAPAVLAVADPLATAATALLPRSTRIGKQPMSVPGRF